MRTNGIIFVPLLLAVLCASCGYHVAGTGDSLPSTIKTIAVPAFTNATTRYKLTDRLPDAVAREFITRTRYRVVPNESDADMVLRGVVVNYSSYATIYDAERQRASGVELHVTLQISLVERTTGKVLYSRPAMDVRERYQIAADPTLYYEESEDALNRASRAVARLVVSGVLNNF